MAHPILDLDEAEIRLARAARSYIQKEEATVTKDNPEGEAGEEFLALCKAATEYERSRAKQARIGK